MQLREHIKSDERVIKKEPKSVGFSYNLVCPNCNNKIKEHDNFCKICGQAIKVEV